MRFLKFEYSRLSLFHIIITYTCSFTHVFQFSISHHLKDANKDVHYYVLSHQADCNLEIVRRSLHM